MTTVYQDSTIAYFDLTSFYFGCVTSLAQGSAATLLNCTLTATCGNPEGALVKRQSFRFTTNGGLTQQMVQAKVSLVDR